MHNLHTEERIKYLKKYGFVVHTTSDPDVKEHGHSFLEFTYIESGKMEHAFEGEVSTLSAGDFFIVDYGTKHRYKGDKNLKVINFLFYPDFVDRTLARTECFEKVVNSYFIRFKYQSLMHSPTGVVFHDENNEVYNIINQIIKEFRQEKDGFFECIRCLIVQMFIIIMRMVGKKEGAKNESPVIKEITDYIKINYSEPLSLGEFAKRYNYSLSHISKKFSAEVGVGFTQYLQKIRIEQSCRLLEAGQHTVSEIATLVGYSNIKFFNKVFKETLGVTPREFKKINIK